MRATAPPVLPGLGVNQEGDPQQDRKRPGNGERHPVAEVPSVDSATRSGASSTVDSTVRPRPVTLIGAKLYHLLIANGYVITGICRSCGAPLTSPRSVAAGVGPVCGRRVVK